jgi:hypothetical protein
VTVAPDFAAPFVGWRTWLVVREGDGYRLGSVVQPTLWEPRRELVGECLGRRRRLWPLRRRSRAPHQTPGYFCSCGVYASRDPDLASQYVFAQYHRRRVAARVIGLVSLWGRVVASPRGWRAEFAYPARIYVPVDSKELADPSGVEEMALSLADYGVPVEIVSHGGEPELLQSLATHSLT